MDVRLDIDSNGNPQIKIKHKDKDDSLEQKLLGQLIESMRSNGVVVGNPSGGLRTGEGGDSWEFYTIKADIEK